MPENQVIVIDHPLVQHKLSVMRSKDTNTNDFRNLIREISILMGYEILRAGTGFLDGLLQLVPLARVGHIGLYRDPETLVPVEYYLKLPDDMPQRRVIVVDPMLATGNSAIAAVERVKDSDATDVKFMCLIASPEGLKAFHDAHPDVPVYTAAIDRELNDHGYILPGIGDAGDRIFGTK